jgi:copper(I)-binding protein
MYTPTVLVPGITARSRILVGGALLGVALLSGCAGSSSSATPSPSATASASATSSPAAAGLTFTDAWVKVAPNGLTAMFGTLDNPTDHEITVVSATTPAAAAVELHEVAMVGGAMKMQPKASGFVVPAHGTHQLKPGVDHLMMMGLTKAIKAGDLVSATLALSGGATVPISAIGKDFAAGNESYQPSGAMSMTP